MKQYFRTICLALAVNLAGSSGLAQSSNDIGKELPPKGNFSAVETYNPDYAIKSTFFIADALKLNSTFSSADFSIDNKKKNGFYTSGTYSSNMLKIRIR